MAKDVIYVRHRPIEVKAFRSPQGMVGQWTAKKAQEVAVVSRAEAPKPGQSKGYATGETATTIKVKGPTAGRKGPEAEIVSGTDHAFDLHEGTAPHTIKARPGKKLVFFGKAGRVIADKVFHPGTKANPFLVRALRKVFGGAGR